MRMRDLKMFTSLDNRDYREKWLSLKQEGRDLFFDAMVCLQTGFYSKVVYDRMVTFKEDKE